VYDAKKYFNEIGCKDGLNWVREFQPLTSVKTVINRSAPQSRALPDRWNNNELFKERPEA
jgi:hypothetical protein